MDQQFYFETAGRVVSGGIPQDQVNCDLYFKTESENDPLFVEVESRGCSVAWTMEVNVYVIEDECMCQMKSTGSRDSAYAISDTVRYTSTEKGWKCSKELSVDGFRERHEEECECTARLSCRVRLYEKVADA